MVIPSTFSCGLSPGTAALFFETAPDPEPRPSTLQQPVLQGLLAPDAAGRVSAFRKWAAALPTDKDKRAKARVIMDQIMDPLRWEANQVCEECGCKPLNPQTQNLKPLNPEP